jgi:cyclophilin family peptidyl-prolyl cis-trans isomerase
MARVGASSNASAAEKEKAHNSASSQFFIVHKTNESSVNLNGDYASFGYVLAGMDVVDAIATCEVWGKGSEAPLPAVDVVIESITFVELK